MLFLRPVYGVRGHVPIGAGRGHQAKAAGRLARLVRSRYRNAATLGNLLHEVNNNLQLTGIDPRFLRLANQVNDTGKRAVHQGLLSEDEARRCLQSAREALQLLLSS